MAFLWAAMEGVFAKQIHYCSTILEYKRLQKKVPLSFISSPFRPIKDVVIRSIGCMKTLELEPSSRSIGGHVQPSLLRLPLPFSTTHDLQNLLRHIQAFSS